jgi:hypothetical protein
MEKKTVIALIIIILIIASTAIYLTFSHVEKCKNLSCWETKLEKCSKASYIQDNTDITWKYTIKGKQNNECKVEVKLVQIKQGLSETQVLEGKSMDCYLPLGALVSPESNPTICHGNLKEEMQTLIIEKLHQYILENVGEISEELKTIV